eukprot:TRINITY_DN6231_c0_g1_i4.p1 TRINITY_DN6231_c0_g1~~TRINITY_DN6231_c0_g1_i4.p1  ORF type:complete len:514 (+),score=140.82 TRINITY_DN6231_c0_g1_i4:288-1829(+)
MEVAKDNPTESSLENDRSENGPKISISVDHHVPDSIETMFPPIAIKTSPRWRKNSLQSPFSRPLRHSTSDLPALTPQLQQEMTDSERGEEMGGMSLSVENPLSRSVSEIVKAIETTQNPSPSASYPSFPLHVSPFYSVSTPSSPTSSIFGTSPNGQTEMLGEKRRKPRKRSFINSSSLEEGEAQVPEEELAISEEESLVSAKKCWCFSSHVKDYSVSPRLQSGEVDLIAVKEKETIKEKMQAERNKDTQTREEMEIQLIEDKLTEFHSTYDGFRNYAETIESHNITEPNYIGFGVYLSSFMGSKSLEIMQTLNIKFILVAARKLQQRFPQDLDYLQLDILDWPGEDILSHFDYACDFMRDAIWSNSNVLVHCAAGVSRSASCVIAYIMREHQIGFYQARRLARMRRDCVKPNRGFVRQLLLWERFNYNIKCDREIYLGWKMEAYYKEAKMAPFSTVQLGIDPLELFTSENLESRRKKPSIHVVRRLVEQRQFGVVHKRVVRKNAFCNSLLGCR